MITEGKKAPAFSLESDEGSQVSLKDFKGKTVILYFYPKDSTPGCTQQGCDFRDEYSAFKKKDVVILGVSKDSVKSHQKFKEKYDFPFLLLSDPESQVCKDYGVWKEKSLYGRKYMGVERTTFLISPDGKIKKIYPNVKVKDHIQAILTDLRSKT